MPDATVSGSDEGGTTDATTAGEASGDSGFDADIQYADAARLTLALEAAASAAVPEGSTVDAAPPPPWASWPVCNPDAYVGKHEVPDDAGTCATFGWTTNFDSGISSRNECNSPIQTDAGPIPRTCDECVRCNKCGVYAATNGQVGGGTFPPCSDLARDGGGPTAVQGPAAGQPLFQLCAALFECVSTSGCTGDGGSDPNATVANCYCGTASSSDCLNGNGNGACKGEIESAMQAGPSISATQIVMSLTDLQGVDGQNGGGGPGPLSVCSHRLLRYVLPMTSRPPARFVAAARSLLATSILVGSAVIFAAGCSDVGDSSAVPGQGREAGSGEDATFLSGDDSGETGSSSTVSGDSTTSSGTEDSGALGEEPGVAADTGVPGSDGGTEQDAVMSTADAPVDSAAVQPETSSVVDAGQDVGSDTSVPEASPDVSTEAQTDAGDASQSVPDTGVDATLDSGAGVDCPMPEACTQAPCGNNCVPCWGSSTTGVCTPTEALVINYDILKNALTATAPPSKATSCYYCMIAGICLDSLPKESVEVDGVKVITENAQGLECGDPMTADNIAAMNPGQCLDALSCTLTGNGSNVTCTTSTPDMASTDPNATVGNCYCGANMGADCINPSLGPIGVCKANEATDVSAYVGGASDVTDTLADFTAPNLSPGGVGNQVLNCALTANCNACFK